MTRRVKMTYAIGAVLILLGAGLLWVLVVSPRLGEATDISAQTDDLAMSNSTLRTRYSNLVRQAKEAPAQAAEFQQLLERMPSQTDLPSIIRQLTDAAVSAGILKPNIKNISTSVPSVVSNNANSSTGGPAELAQIEVAMDLVGTPAQITQFTANLEAMPRAMLITGTTYQFQREQKVPLKVDASVNGRMFVLRSEVPDVVANVNALLEKAVPPAS